MGGLFSSPSPPPPPPEPETDPAEEERKLRLEMLNRRRRGRAGTIETSERGLLTPVHQDQAKPKTLLGE